MKFGSQLKRTSVPEWKSYNIDYNDIKGKIKRATTTEDKTQKEHLIKELHDSLIEQIDIVNLFVASKDGEIRRRTCHLEKLLDCATDFPAPLNTESQQSITFETEISKLSSDLQKLSRFLVLQKTALRKLLKKYSKYSKDGGELNTKINKYVINCPKSFVHVDLSGLYLEVALMYDLIREKNNLDNINSPSVASPTKQPTESRRRSSIVNPVDYLNKDESFDFDSFHKSTQTLKYFVHYDNLNELKLFLLQKFYLIDQSMNNQKQYLQLARKTSSRSIREIIETQKAKLKPVKEESEATNGKTDGRTADKDDINASTEIYRSNSFYLNSSDQSTMGSKLTELVFDDPNNFNSIKNNTDATVLLTKDNEEFRSLLISSIGGLRKNSNILFHDLGMLEKLIDACLNDDDYFKFQQDNQAFVDSLDSLEKVSVEYVLKKHLKPLVKTNLINSRFSNSVETNASNKGEFKCWISLKSNIKNSASNLNTPIWTTVDEESAETFKHAYLEIRHNSPHNDESPFPESLQELINSHLIYRIEDDSFTTLTYSLYRSGKLSFKPHWSEILEDKDIRKLPSKVTRKAKARNPEVSSANETKKSSVSGESSQQFRYWNEFDNGSDFGADDTGFFIPLEDSDDSESAKVLFFSNSTIDKFYEMSFKLSEILHEKFPLIFEPLSQKSNTNTDGPTDYDPLLPNSSPYENHTTDPSQLRNSHSDIESITSNSTSNSMLYSLHNSKLAHDKFIIFLALSTSLLSLFLTTVALIISTSLMSRGEVLVNGFVLFILVFALLTSLFFAILSICLYMLSDSENRSNLQSMFIWVNFFMVNFMIICGLIIVFGI